MSRKLLVVQPKEETLQKATAAGIRVFECRLSLCIGRSCDRRSGQWFSLIILGPGILESKMMSWNLS